MPPLACHSPPTIELFGGIVLVGMVGMLPLAVAAAALLLAMRRRWLDGAWTRALTEGAVAYALGLAAWCAAGAGLLLVEAWLHPYPMPGTDADALFETAGISLLLGSPLLAVGLRLHRIAQRARRVGPALA